MQQSTRSTLEEVIRAYRDYEEYASSSGSDSDSSNSSSSSDNFDEEWLTMLSCTLLGISASYFDKIKQEMKFKAYDNNPERVNWARHVELKEHHNKFQSTYCMQHETFKTLVEMIREKITFNIVKALNSAPNMQPIYPELVVAVGMRFMSGGKKTDIKDWANISKTSYYRC